MCNKYILIINSNIISFIIFLYCIELFLVAANERR